MGQVVAGRVRPAELPSSGRRVEVWSGGDEFLRVHDGSILIELVFLVKIRE